jgi:two-component system sensor histidine kinase KdpD
MALVGLATLIGLPFRPSINPTNLVMPYLVAVILAGFWLGRYPAIVASLLSVIAFDIIFVPPVYTFGVADAEYFLTFVGFLAVGLVISTLTARAADQEQAARRRERQTAALYDLSQKLAALTEIADIAQAAVNQVEATAGHAAALFLPDGNKQMVLQAQTAGFALETESAAVAAWVFRHGQPAGRHTDTLTNVGAHFLPLSTAGQAVGVLSVCVPARPSILSVEERRLLVSMASQIALAVDKARLAERARQTRLLEETERLQTALLNSISHDLRSPLATITGALSSLHDDVELLSPAAQHELVETAWAEARRLNRLVGNLLDMTRLESGTLKVVRQPADVQDLVGSALAQLPNRLRGRPLEVQLAPDLPLVDLDFTLMIQVLVNLIDNALKYAPPEEPIEISGRQLPAGEVVVSVSDRGAGLPEAELEHVFDRFFRIEDKGIGGTGLGLSIAKGIVEAHGGRVWAENRIGGGASF